jgi:hypothetical protein
MDITDISSMTAALVPMLVTSAQQLGQNVLDDFVDGASQSIASSAKTAMSSLSRKLISRFRDNSDSDALRALTKLSADPLDRPALEVLQHSTSSLLQNDREMRELVYQALSQITQSPVHSQINAYEGSTIGKVTTVGNQTINGDVTF